MTAVFTDETSLKLTSVAFVAFTTQADPASPGVNTPLSTLHVPDTREKDTAPTPEPPEAVKVNGSPYVACVDVTDTTA